MNGFEQMFEDLVTATSNRRVEGDYEIEGMLYCGKCHTAKQSKVEYPKGTIRKVSVICRCQAADMAEQRKADEWKEFEIGMARQNGGITDKNYLDYTFEKSTGESEAIKIARKYVDEWQIMKESNAGMLLSGPVGTGKTFIAGCIANALYKQRISVCMTNFTRILNNLQTSNEKQAIIDQLAIYDLLVIDDLGAERTTEYAIEQVFAIVDVRYRAKKPLIVTTNLSVIELKSPKVTPYARIFDRVLEMCPIQLRVEGISRRIKSSEEKRNNAMKILGL